LPFKSLPVDAAVAEVFATLLVSAADERTCARLIPSSCADDLRDLGVESLTHLRPTVAYEHGAVGVDVDQRAGLVVMDDVERDAELDGRERNAFPEHGLDALNASMARRRCR
jgi:hypothetical protein